MVFTSLAVSQGSSPKSGSRLGAAIDTLLIHHMASTDGPGTTAMMRRAGGRTVSANYTIHNDGTIHGVVPEERRAWTSGAAGDGGKGAAWDRRSITVEIENESGDPDWRISEAALNACAALLKDLRNRYGIRNVLGHRDLFQRFGASYPTYCPGPNTVADIVRRAGGNPQASGGGYPDGAVIVNGLSVRQVQERLVAHGFGVGSHGVDGDMGPDTIAALRAFQKAKGLTVDAIVGQDTWAALSAAPAGSKPTPAPKPQATPKPQQTAKAPAFPLPSGWYFGPQEGPQESVSGYHGHREDLRRFQAQMQARGWDFSRHGVDGLYGAETRENVLAFQREKRLKVDGLIGPETWRAAWEAPVS